MYNFIMQITNFLWSWPVAGVLLCAGLYYSVRLGFPQIRFFNKIIGTLKVERNSEEGGISGFAALCATVGGQVGTGSLVGVASALASGGPGALFWMWVTAIFGMALSFGEAVLGQLFHEKSADGNYYGGAPYYMRKGIPSKLCGIILACCTLCSAGLFIAMLQNNSISAAVVQLIPVSPIIPGIIVTLLAAVIVMGGVKRITDIASYVVPFMAIAYILVTLFIVITHIGELPAVIGNVLRSAFTIHAAAGGVVGYTIKEAFRHGVARGLFSNDAGNGAAATMHASANAKHPVKQGFAAMVGTFLTTIVICSCTGFAILLTGSMESGADGINLVQTAFSKAIGPAGSWFICGAMFFFGFTTLVADLFYGEVSIRYIFKENTEKLVKIYQVIALICVAIGSVVPLPSIWNMVDFIAAISIAVNVYALIKLFKYVGFVYKDYTNQLKQGVKEPLWNGDSDIKEEYSRQMK